MGAPLKPKTRWRFEQIGRILLKLAVEHDLDFITLQETFDASLRDEFIVNPWREKYSFHACANDKGARFVASGLSTLSRLEIKESKFRSYTRGGGVDRFVNKGVLFTRLKTRDGSEVDIYNAHPQASYISQRRRSKVRISQIYELVEFIQETHETDNPILLTGDLNIEEYNEEYTILVDRTGDLNEGSFKFLDMMRQLFPDKQLYPFKTLRKTNPLQERKLDHVFIRPGKGWKWMKEESSTRVLDFGLSDHRAVLSTVTFCG